MDNYTGKIYPVLDGWMDIPLQQVWHEVERDAGEQGPMRIPPSRSRAGVSVSLLAHRAVVQYIQLLGQQIRSWTIVFHSSISMSFWSQILRSLELPKIIDFASQRIYCIRVGLPTGITSERKYIDSKKGTISKYSF
jgi:hypothetical protein